MLLKAPREVTPSLFLYLILISVVHYENVLPFIHFNSTENSSFNDHNTSKKENKKVGEVCFLIHIC